MWKKDLMNITETKNHTFQRGELTAIFKELSNTYEEDLNKIKNYYYRNRKKTTSEPEQQKKKRNPDAPITPNDTLSLNEPKDNTNEPKEKVHFEFFRTYPFEKEVCKSYLNQEGTEFLSFKSLIDNFEDEESLLSFTAKSNFEVIVYGDDILLDKTSVISLLNKFSNSSSSLYVLKTVTSILTILNATEHQIERKLTEKEFNEIRIGDTLDLKIDKILPYGAMVIYPKNPAITGIIHISQIRRGFVENIHDFFTEGENVTAKVVGKNENFKLSLSTKGYPLKEGVEHKSETHSRKQSVGQPSINHNRELNEFENYLSDITGPLSPKAKEKMKVLIGEYGIVQSSITLSKVQSEQDTDLALIVLNLMEKKLKESL